MSGYDLKIRIAILPFIVNMQGQAVYNKDSSGKKSSIELSEINANGLVFVHVLSGNKTIVVKVSVQK